MPTGYTSAIADGISFREFTLRCARAMGACVMQRDAPANELPKIQESSSYYKESLDKAEKLLEEAKNMDDATAAQKSKEDYESRVNSIYKSIQDKNDLLAKYKSMLKQVASWEPPTSEHYGLKNFMQEQITGSIDFDCDTSYYKKELATIRPISATEWKNEQVKKAIKDVLYYKKALAEEDGRNDSRNEWIKKLYESLEEKGSATKH